MAGSRWMRLTGCARSSGLMTERWLILRATTQNPRPETPRGLDDDGAGWPVSKVELLGGTVTIHRRVAGVGGR